MTKLIQDMVDLQGEIRIYLITNASKGAQANACDLLDMVMKSEVCKEEHKQEYANMK